MNISSRLHVEEPDYEQINRELCAALADLIRLAKQEGLHLKFNCALEVNRAEEALKKARAL